MSKPSIVKSIHAYGNEQTARTAGNAASTAVLVTVKGATALARKANGVRKARKAAKPANAIRGYVGKHRA